MGEWNMTLAAYPRPFVISLVLTDLIRQPLLRPICGLIAVASDFDVAVWNSPNVIVSGKRRLKFKQVKIPFSPLGGCGRAHISHVTGASRSDTKGTV